MTIEKILDKEIEEYNRDELYNSLINFSMNEKKFIISYTKYLIEELVVGLIPTEADVKNYVNGAFGYDESARESESAFISGADWMREGSITRLEIFLKDGKK